MADLLRDDDINLWALVLNHPSGVGLDCFGGMLTARRNEDGRFAVAWGSALNEEQSFDTASAAARFFRDKRVEMQLGYDFEVEPNG